MHAAQMKEHLKGISSSLVLIDDIHLYVLKAEGPQVQHRRSDAMHASINKVRPAWLALNTVCTIVCKAGAKNVWVCEVYDMLLLFPEERTNGAYDPL